MVVFLFLFPLASVATASPFTIVKDGKAVAAIALVNESALLRQASGELRFWIRQMTGADIPVLAVSSQDIGNNPAPLIVFATRDQFPEIARREKLLSLNPEGFVIVPTAKRLWILCNSEQAIGPAVYTLLDTLGCRWFFPHPAWTIVPRNSTIVIKSRIRQQPAFRYRLIWYEWGAPTPELRAQYEDWMRRNRQFGHFPFDTGHAYERYIPHHIFEQHPEWFALVGGVRRPTQLCVSNPEVQRIVTEKVLEAFRSRPDLNMVSVEPNDGGGYCECDRCRQLGSVSDQVFFFANLIAKEVRKEFPTKWVGLLSYAFHSEPPSFPIEKGIYVQVTTGFRYTRLTFTEQVRAFQRLGAQVGVYDYFSVYPWDFDLPGAAKAARVTELAEKIKEYHRLGLTTYCAESSLNWGPNGLGYWIAARLMWDPYQDPKRLVQEFCQIAFGSAAGPVKRIYERWAKGERFSPRSLRLALEDLSVAYRLAADESVRQRLDHIACYLHYLRLWWDYDRLSQQYAANRDPVLRDQLLSAARHCIQFIRRVRDLGVIHSYATLFTEWFPIRFEVLVKLAQVDPSEIERWKQERTDVPAAEEIRSLIAQDLNHLRQIVPCAIEIEESLSPSQHLQYLKQKDWLENHRASSKAVGSFFVRQASFFFKGTKGRALKIGVMRAESSAEPLPFRWRLGPLSGRLSEWRRGTLEHSQPQTVNIICPITDICRLDIRCERPEGVALDFGPIPVAVWCGREDGDDDSQPLGLQIDRADSTLSLFVPKETTGIIIGIVGGKEVSIPIEMSNGGRVVLKDTLFPRSQITTIVERDIEEYGDISEMGKQAIVPADELCGLLKREDLGKFLALKIDGSRFRLEIFNVPPFIFP
ncbi:MAG: DUF4838 domain-containing protein [Armatimonadetes bacterium]|nr:DUF4838 domain-containing protein [Armatimonadota bacterium]